VLRFVFVVSVDAVPIHAACHRRSFLIGLDSIRR
jgi:hypothetical protein